MSYIFTRQRMDEKGAVSFLSVLVFIIIIVTLSLAYMQSVTRQQRNALNFDMGNRAYYAAEAGVQDTIRALRSGNINLTDGSKDYCLENGDQDAFGGTGAIGGNDQYGLKFTCQLVDTTIITGNLNPGRDSVTMKLKPLSGSFPSSFTLRLRWGVPSEGVSQQTMYVARGGTFRYFPPTTNWNSGGVLDGTDNARPVHPLLRAAAITHPGANFERSQVTQRVAFLNPVSISSGGGFGIVPFNINASESNKQLGAVSTATCRPDATPAGEYACSAYLQLSGHQSELYLNLSAFYRTAAFEVVALDGSTVIPLAETMATVDVTGRAGRDVFRRVKQTVRLGDNYRVHSGPEAALTVGDGICKAFSVTGTASSFNSSCTP